MHCCCLFVLETHRYRGGRGPSAEARRGSRQKAASPTRCSTTDGFDLMRRAPTPHQSLEGKDFFFMMRVVLQVVSSHRVMFVKKRRDLFYFILFSFIFYATAYYSLWFLIVVLKKITMVVPGIRGRQETCLIQRQDLDRILTKFSTV